MKILVVEDDHSVRETMGMVLDYLHHESQLVTEGNQALRSLEEVWPDLMVLDLTLPGMSGEEIFAEVRRRFGRTPPTIVMTAATQGQQRAAQMQGAYFLAKPYTLEQLEAKIQEVLHSLKAAA